MKALSKTLLVILLIATFSVQAFTQEARWKELNEHVVSLYQQGRYSEAAQVAERALKVAENTFGPDHQQVGTSVNNLAALYRAQGKYTEAEPL